jgi:Iap family predicted aminopeptidase
MRLVPLLLAAALLAGCDSSDGGEEPAPEPERPPAAISRAELDEHLAALERIAARSGGNRAVGTRGYAESVEYAARRLREAGWRVRLEPFTVGVFALEGASLRIGGRRLGRARDFQVLTYSGSGRAAGALRRLPDGCDAEEFSALGGGELPVVSRTGCFFRVKAANAERAGARALIVVDDSQTSRGVPSGTLAVPGIGIPVLLVSDQALESAGDGERATVSVRASTRRRRSQNVIADTPGGGGPIVMAGGHLDSVPGGPGVNDNGSGVAALIELAEAIGPDPPGARVRIGLWGAEEVGLAGSRHHVRSLGRAGRRRIAVYLNLDMVGSPNAVGEVYGDGDPRLERLLRRAFGRRLAAVEAGGGSDHAPFQEAGVAIGGLYTGGPERGPGGRPRDPCYHLACDTARNVDRRTLLRMARAAAEAVETLSARHR